MNLKKGLVLFSVGLISVIRIILLKSINSHSNNNVIAETGIIISTKKIDPGYLTKRQEAQGIKIYNNRIYFGFVYRPNCIWDSNKNNCKSVTLYEPLNAIYYMG